MTVPGWCAKLPRAVYSSLERVSVSDSWFQVYRVAPDVYAIYEPNQFQEVISYLIVGSSRALLFDTGLGIGDIRSITRALTPHQVVVLNSHTHYDHTGGNAAFDSILAVNTPYTRTNALGFKHDVVKGEVAPNALCAPLPEGFDATSYAVRRWMPTQLIGDGERINLGNRVLEVLQVPGHTPDAVALLDSAAGFLWTGDSFYEGPIWLFAPETDWAAYARSVDRLAALVPRLTRVFAAHNVASSDPQLLLRLQGAVQEVRSGRASPVIDSEKRVTFDFGAFSFITSEAALAGTHPDDAGGSGLPPSP